MQLPRLKCMCCTSNILHVLCLTAMHCNCHLDSSSKKPSLSTANWLYRIVGVDSRGIYESLPFLCWESHPLSSAHSVSGVEALVVYIYCLYASITNRSKVMLVGIYGIECGDRVGLTGSTLKLNLTSIPRYSCFLQPAVACWSQYTVLYQIPFAHMLQSGYQAPISPVLLMVGEVTCTGYSWQSAAAP